MLAALINQTLERVRQHLTSGKGNEELDPAKTAVERTTRLQRVCDLLQVGPQHLDALDVVAHVDLLVGAVRACMQGVEPHRGRSKEDKGSKCAFQTVTKEIGNTFVCDPICRNPELDCAVCVLSTIALRVRIKTHRRRTPQ